MVEIGISYQIKINPYMKKKNIFIIAAQLGPTYSSTQLSLIIPLQVVLPNLSEQIYVNYSWYKNGFKIVFLPYLFIIQRIFKETCLRKITKVSNTKNIDTQFLQLEKIVKAK